ncbi:hypothetical protein DN752_22750 [Echinicola strongylocentroti]|uniref:Uncharacterized protein n=2 Tax=Echinicola strongylocentroti TaxID=1795355 RepID=A0A2Z4IPK8_9BACT|nr:hypothetical protein DN752_22750 [Echinicola strongylocentroti]
MSGYLPFEGGTQVPAFWYRKEKLEERKDIDGLTAHIDLYQPFCEVAGAKLRVKMHLLSERYLVPLPD